jgi:hypothetical protein
MSEMPLEIRALLLVVLVVSLVGIGYWLIS